jgi:biotin carboxyl carrier protein
MKYFVRVGGRTFEVEVGGDRVTVDGTSVEAHLGAVPGTPLHHLLLGSESWTVAVEPSDDPDGPVGAHWVVSALGERRDVSVVDERTRQIQELTGEKVPSLSSGVVRAPMPGLVVRVEVNVGDRVAAGAGLVVVEAMKMENELRATVRGVVAAVHVTPGQPVEKGTPLVTLELTGP